MDLKGRLLALNSSSCLFEKDSVVSGVLITGECLAVRGVLVGRISIKKLRSPREIPEKACCQVS